MNIVEFAKSLGLSIGTVSRALNDRPEVSPVTRKMVLKRAEEMGFVRNANARRLVTGQNLMIRLECPYNTHILSDRYLVEMARAIEESAVTHGYDLLLHLGTRQRDTASEIEAIDGLVIIAAPDTTVQDIQKLSHNGSTPTVVITGSTPLDYPAVSYVCLDTLPGIRAAIKELADLGHRRVGYIGSDHYSTSLRRALPGLMTEVGLSWDPEMAIDAGIAQEDGYNAARTLLSLPVRPTALFARTDILASGAIQAAHSLGMFVPEDVSIIGHDNIEVAALVSPPMTTVAINIPEMAAIAVRLLVAQMVDKASPAVEHLGTHLVIRKSCGPAPLEA